MTICPKNDENIRDDFKIIGTNIKGPNLVTQVIELARKTYGELLPLSVELDKKFPTGSGIGAGSGNAAGMISWLRKYYGLTGERAVFSKLGADITFLSGLNDLAFVSGVGEKAEPISGDLPFCWVLVFPKWRSDTAEAYSKLDEYRKSKGLALLSAGEAHDEALSVFERLKDKKRAGLLPNDFLLPLTAEHGEYITAGRIASDFGAFGWGLCGSGSAFFALCDSMRAAERLALEYRQQDWVIQTNIVE
ncbi:MAG: hypothetical protein Q4F74_06780 [Synergistaceae bacterium]|nr:hypothetical protein [Synergistaceae bacterium]